MDLERLLMEHGLNVYRLSKQTGIAQSYLSAIAKNEKDYHGITYGRLEKIAEAFGITVDELINS